MEFQQLYVKINIYAISCRWREKLTNKIVVKIDEKYFRPCEVDFLLGDATKAETEMGWTREYELEDLIDDMMKWN